MSNLTPDFTGQRPRYPVSHRSPITGAWVSCAVCKLFFNQYGIPQRAWLRMSACARSLYEPNPK